MKTVGPNLLTPRNLLILRLSSGLFELGLGVPGPWTPPSTMYSVVSVFQTVQPDPDQCCPSCFPYGFRREAVELLKLTWPLVSRATDTAAAGD